MKNVLMFNFSDGSRTIHTFTDNCNPVVFAKDVQSVLEARQSFRDLPSLSRKSTALPTHRKIASLTFIAQGTDYSHALTGMQFSGKKFIADIPGIVERVIKLSNAIANGIGTLEYEAKPKALPSPKEQVLSELSAIIGQSPDPVELAESVIKSVNRKLAKPNAGRKVIKYKLAD